MSPLFFFHKMRLKAKLFAAFVVTIVPLMGLSSYISYAYLKQNYLTNSAKELKNSADSLVKMIDTAASVAIKNYLRAVAEKNLEAVEGYYAAYRSGRIDEDRMLSRAYDLFGSQTIGHAGYIYCINSNGVAIYHPNKGVQGNDYRHFPFIQEQIRKKTGYLEYAWKNPEDTDMRPKAMYMVYFEPLDWIITASAYRDEFRRLVHLSDIRDNVAALRFKGAGYAFLIDRNGELLIHPDRDRASNISDITDDKGGRFFDAIQAAKHGEIRYTYIDPSSRKPTPKVAYFDLIDTYGWFVGASYPEYEVLKPLHTVRAIIVLTALLILAMSVGVAIWFSSYANGHIQELIAAFEEGASGHFKVRLKTRSKDEFGRLSRYFNTFMERLESYQHTLLEEIDKRRQMQNTVYENEQRLKMLVHSAPVLLWAIDGKGILNFYEGKLPVQFDQCECMDIGRHLKDLWDQWYELPEHIDRALAGGSGVLLIDRPDYVIEIHYNPLTGANQQVVGAVGVAVDVTSRWRAERKLSESEQDRQKLAMAVEQAAEIFIISDTAGNIEYVNPAFEKTSGYLKMEAIGQNINILRSDKHDKHFYADLWKTISEGGIWSGRLVNRKKDGTIFYENATISPLRNEKGDIVNYVASKRDVTNEVILENQLQHAQRMKAIGTLAGGIAHDFNNILSGIMGYTQICQYEAPPESAISRRLEKIMTACDRAKELISHIQTFSRQSGVEPIPMLPAPVVSEAVKLIQASYPAQIINRRIMDVGAVMAVPAQFHQIVMNLCTNACHAMLPDGGQLTVSLSREAIDNESARRILDISEGDYAVLAVTDTGHGIPAEIMNKIFDPYFTTKAEDEGTGLGLSVVHGIVKSLEGALKVYSEPGRGTTFKIYIPLLATDNKQDAPRERATPMGNHESVLIVDDDASVLESTQEMLESLNYRTSARNSTVEALEFVRAQPQRFDMIISDFSVPHLNGLEFASAVKKLRPDLPIIICTGFSYDERLEKAEKDGMVGLINKPIIRSELARKIAVVFQQYVSRNSGAGS